MFVSLKGRLQALILLLAVASIAAGALMAGLFRQSATARVGQSEAQLQRACESIVDAYRFYTAGWRGPEVLSDSNFKHGLLTVVQSALLRQPGIEGGIWQGSAGSLAYAYPTYEGSGPKTDLPPAESVRIRDMNRRAQTEDRLASGRYSTPSQTLLLTACPLPGPVAEATAWAMTRVMTFEGRAYTQLMTGFAILLVTVLTATLLLVPLTLTWSRHIDSIQTALAKHDLAELPRLSLTGERELDQIVAALNDASARLSSELERAQLLSRQVATAERLAAIGGVVAGVAHEIRNPIAAMRLKAENALATGGERYQEALSAILQYIARLDRLLRRLLTVTEPERAQVRTVDLADFLRRCADSHREAARARGVRIETGTSVPAAHLDPEMISSALDNLLLNALEAAPPHSQIELRARGEADRLIISVRDAGSGPPVAIRDRLFEPFVTGRAAGTGLGLSIVREAAEAHGGTARCSSEPPTTFEIILPCRGY